MSERQRQAAGAAVAYALVAVIATLSGIASASARPVDVVARTVIAFDSFADGLDVSVDGVLRDNNGARLARRVVVVAFHRQGQPIAALTETTRSDASGQFRLERRLQPGVWELAVSFEGDDFHDGATASATVEAAPFETYLEMSAPRTLRAGVERVIVQVTATAGQEPVPPSWLSVNATCGPIQPIASEQWELVWQADGSRCAVSASIDGGVEAVPATSMLTLRRLGAVGLTGGAEWASRTVFDRPTWRLSLTAADEFGPVEGLRILVEEGSGEQAFAEARTDEEGVASVVVEGEFDEVEALAWLDEPPISVGSPVTLVLRQPARALRVVPLASGALALLLLVAIGLRVIRERRDVRPSVVEPPPPPRPGVTQEASAAPSCDDDVPLVHGVVLDAEWGVPVEATLSAADGRQWRCDEDGRFAPGIAEPIVVTVAAPGFASLRVSLRPPASGRHLVVRLEAWRTRLLSTWVDLVRDVEPEGVKAERWWGRETISEVRGAMVQSLRALRRDREPEPVNQRALDVAVQQAMQTRDAADAADALGRLVAQRYFDATTVSEQDVELATQLAAFARGDVA